MPQVSGDPVEEGPLAGLRDTPPRMRTICGSLSMTLLLLALSGGGESKLLTQGCQDGSPRRNGWHGAVVKTIVVGREAA
jgi:hypothetical protein